ncbi:MAG: hypothetical protein A4E67_00872 [Syntrophaceae bacterium PtaB.Bin038]|jgi:hypothetical protein|nr:MAG: hypothetical protein A4E67_00872 [Syntrophaceae bacterium PtaB.Bin038]
MPLRLAAALLPVVVLALGSYGCAPSMTYLEGPLATDHRTLSKEDLDRYAARIDEEIVRIEKGAPPPADVPREAYLADLRSRRYEVRTTIAGRELMRQDEIRRRMELQRPLP